MAAYEVNFDGLVGPTHHYAGLAFGNTASMSQRMTVSNPRQAALQGLAKMKLMMDLGIKQGILPPRERPNIPWLRGLGFSGSDADVLEQAHKADHALLAAACSASSMWAANAATVSPSADTIDVRVHFTPANLVSNLHRAIEAQETGAILQAIFADEAHFVHHPPLTPSIQLGDEGAANHTRLCDEHDLPGVEIFTYGRAAYDSNAPAPSKYPARQTREASQAIARLHQLDPSRTLFVQQSPVAIDAGAFHNDVVAVGHRHVLLYHEYAFADRASVLKQLDQVMPNLFPIEVPSDRMPLSDAVSSYLFNSQLITTGGGEMQLIAPMECQQYQRAHDLLLSLIAGSPITQVRFVDVRQSMANGGGPACLRLRVALTSDQLAAIRGNVLLTNELYAELQTWIQNHYPEELRPDDLRDPNLLDESRMALDTLTRLLDLGSIYLFQKG